MAALEGWSQEKEATQEIQNMCDEIRSDAEKAVGKALGAFTAKKFIKKAGPGPDYIIKVHVGADEYIHVKMCQCDGGKLKFSGHQHPKTKVDRLEFIVCIINR